MTTFPFISAPEKEAAEACGVGDDEIRRWVREGILTPHYAGARSSKPLYRAEDLDAAVRALPIESAKSAARSR